MYLEVVEDLKLLEELLERFIVIEEDFLQDLYIKVQEYATFNQIEEIKKEVGSYYLIEINGKNYQLGKYFKQDKFHYFICHSLEMEEAIIEIKKEETKKLVMGR